MGWGAILHARRLLEGGRFEMSWFFLALTVGTSGLAGLAVYWLLRARLRRQAHEAGLLLDCFTEWLESLPAQERVGGVAIEWPASFAKWGLDMDCGIEVV